MRVLICGASGFIGTNLVGAMIEAGHQVIACSRHPDRVCDRWPEVKIIAADLSGDLTVEDWIPRLQGIDLVINAVGIIRENGTQTFEALHTRGPIALFQACEKARVRRVIQLSALGADETASSRYHLSKQRADHYLKGLSLDWVIVKPSIVYGPGAKSMALFKALAALPLIPLVGGGRQQIQPIYIDDLVRAMMQLIAAPSEIRAEIEMVGPDPITMRNLYEKLHRWFGFGPPRFIPVAYHLALTGARLAGFFGKSPLTAENLKMLQQGNTADVTPFVSQLGFMPRSLDQALTTTPALQQDRWHAGLYFLRPVLRLSIALVWIFTGIVSIFFYPLEQSYAMLAQVGVQGIWQPIMLYTAAILDLLLGVTLLYGYRVQLMGLLQIAIILIYSLIITLALPEQWVHPFGPVIKNLPLVVATLIMLALERGE